MGNHTKRSREFEMTIKRLAEKVLHGTLDGKERLDVANILVTCTTDSQCMVKAADDEPVFVLRGKDRVAGPAVGYWIGRSIAEGLHQDKVDDAVECSKEMEKYHEIMNPSKEYCLAAKNAVIAVAKKERLVPDTQLYDAFLGSAQV